jgi:hypothetical protein
MMTIRSAPRRFAAMMPQRPTAPSHDGDRLAGADRGGDGGVVARTRPRA